MHSEDMASSGQTNVPVIVEPLEMPASSERVPTLLEQVILEVVHPVQYGIVPERIALPRPDDQILSGYDEDISSITRWVYCGENV